MNRQLWIGSTVLAGILFFSLFYFDGTGDTGDSILHFLYSRHAPQHPELYFDHWAKPIYVLLASAFAPMGFTGVKLMNVLLMIVSFIFTVKTAEELKLKNALLSGIFLVFAPLAFILTFSGLTEPLFACLLILAIYLFCKEKVLPAVLLISFLPFVRSEGLFFIGIAGLYLLYKRNWKQIPFLAVGHLVYSIAGLLIYGNLLWVFEKIPYAKMSSTYGKGTLSHFAEQLIYVVGVPLYILFWLGIIVLIWKLIKRQIQAQAGYFIFLGFIVFFVAHTLFWYLGIFNSMGLKRVFVGIMPLMAIISLYGFNFLCVELSGTKTRLRLILSGLVLTYVLIFPFTKNPAAIKWKRDLNLSGELVLAMETANMVREEKGEKHRYFYIHPYFSMALELDHFDPREHGTLNPGFYSKMKKGDVLIWDNWFAVVELGLTKEMIMNQKGLKFLADFKTNYENRDIEFLVFEKVK